MRFNPGLLARTRRQAARDNRTLTNFIADASAAELPPTGRVAARQDR